MWKIATLSSLDSPSVQIWTLQRSPGHDAAAATARPFILPKNTRGGELPARAKGDGSPYSGQASGCRS